MNSTSGARTYYSKHIGMDLHINKNRSPRWIWYMVSGRYSEAVYAQCTQPHTLAHTAIECGWRTLFAIS